MPRPFLAGLAVGALLLSGLVASVQAQPAPKGPQVRFDRPRFPELPEDVDRVLSPLVAAPQPGGLVAVWAESWEHVVHGGPDWMAVRARRFDAQLRPLGEEIVIREPPGEDVFRALFTLDAAADAMGGFVVVWGDDVPPAETTDLLARLYRAEGQPRGEPFRVNSRTDSNPTGARVAMEPEGGFLVTWTATMGGGSPVGAYARAFDAAGEPLGEDFEIPLGGPAVAARPGGGFIIAGRRPRADGAFEVVVQLHGSDGGPVASPVIAGEATAPADVNLGVASDGTFTVTWGSSARRFDAAAQPQGPILRFTDPPFSDDRPTGLAVDAAGGSFVAWSSQEPLLPHSRFRSSDILGRWIDGESGALGPVLRLNTLIEGDQFDARVVALGDGAFAVLWVGTEAMPESSGHGLLRGSGGLLEPQGVFGRHLVRASPGILRFPSGRRVVGEAAGQLRLPVLRRGGTLGPVGAGYTVAVLGARLEEPWIGEGAVHFEDGDLGPHELSVPVLDDGSLERLETFTVTLRDPLGGAVLGSPRRVVIELRDDDHPSPWLAAASEPWRVVPGVAGAVAVDSVPGGGLVLAWQAVDGVRAQRFGPGGEPLGGEIEAAPVFGDELLAPLVVVDADGGSTLIWSENSLEFFAFVGSFAQRFDAGGSPAGEPFQLRSGRRDRLLPLGFAVARGAAGGLIQAAVDGDGSGIGIFVSRYGSEGEPVGSVLRSNVETFGQQRRPAVAAAADGSFVTVWESFTPGEPTHGLYGRWFDPAGEPRSGEILLAEPFHPSGHQIATDSRGNLAVVWQHDDGEGPGIGARAFNTAGAPFGPEVQVNTTTAGVQRSPVVAFASGGPYLVVWESEEPSGDGTLAIRLRGQLLGASGLPVGHEIVIAPGLPGDQLRPAVTPDGVGHFVVVWEQRGEAAVAGVWARRIPIPTLVPHRLR